MKEEKLKAYPLMVENKKMIFIGNKVDMRHRQGKEKDHITMLSGLGSVYLGHLIPLSGQGKEIEKFLHIS